jgi:hypothetical protein
MLNLQRVLKFRQLPVLALGALCIASSPGQTASDKGTGSPSASGTSPNFAIESEMLTYRAVESNSEAIACDIAGYLQGVPAVFTKSDNSACDVKPGNGKFTVVLLPFGTSEFTNFQIWRADMSTMDRLQRKAGEAGCSETRGGATASSILSLTPAGPPLALAQSALALMASEESVSPVVGTVLDQAFMNGVGRELRGLGVSVLMPMAFSPFSFTPLAPENSPFLASLERLMEARECLAAQGTGKPDSTNPPATADAIKAFRVKRTLSDIDDFLNILMGRPVTAAPANKSDASQPPPSGQSSTPAAPTSPASTAPAASTTHLDAVLSADGLARKLGVNPNTGFLSDNGLSQHILLVKALESGGAVLRYANVLGTTVRFSGGAVGTYALFKWDGDLECSGNVYDYAGSIKAKEFTSNFRKYRIQPGEQMIFSRGGCRATR